MGPLIQAIRRWAGRRWMAPGVAVLLVLSVSVSQAVWGQVLALSGVIQFGDFELTDPPSPTPTGTVTPTGTLTPPATETPAPTSTPTETVTSAGTPTPTATETPAPETTATESPVSPSPEPGSPTPADLESPTPAASAENDPTATEAPGHTTGSSP